MFSVVNSNIRRYFPFHPYLVMKVFWSSYGLYWTIIYIYSFYTCKETSQGVWFVLLKKYEDVSYSSYVNYENYWYHYSLSFYIMCIVIILSYHIYHYQGNNKIILNNNLSHHKFILNLMNDTKFLVQIYWLHRFWFHHEIIHIRNS